MKTRLCQSNCPHYLWRVTEESTAVADDEIKADNIQMWYSFNCL